METRRVATKPVVIVLEDDPSMLRALRRLIQSAGFEVRTFDHPRALLDADLPTSNACIVADIHLPEMNGIEACRLLGARSRLLPVILTTAHADESTRRMAATMKPIAFLIKPFSRDALFEAIKKALAT